MTNNLFYILNDLSRQILDVQIQSPKSLKTWPGNKHGQTLSNAVPKPTQNRQKSKPGPKGLASRAPKCLWIARWSPKVPKWTKQVCRISRIGHKKCKHPRPKITMDCSTGDMETTSGQQRTSIKSSKGIRKRHAKNNKPQ